MVQRETDPVGGSDTSAVDGTRIPAGQCHHPARRTLGRTSRRRTLFLQHCRRRLRIAGGRLPASARFWNPGHRHHTDRRSGVGRASLSRKCEADLIDRCPRFRGLNLRRRRRHRTVAAAAFQLPDHAGARTSNGERAAARLERRPHRGHCHHGRAGHRPNPLHQRTSDVVDGAVFAALHACARSYSASLGRQPGDRSRDRLRGRQYHTGSDASSLRSTRRGGGSLQACPDARRLLQEFDWGGAERSAGGRLCQRRAATPANAAPGLLRFDHARTATNCGGRSGGPLFRGVLHSGQDAPQTEGLHEPMAAGVSGAGGVDPGDDSRVPRRLPAERARLGR